MVASRSKSNIPAVGDSVWDETQTGQPNGKVVKVDYHEQEAIVQFFANKYTDKGTVNRSVSFDRFYGNFNAKFNNGTWMLWAEDPPTAESEQTPQGQNQGETDLT